jgi:hypothetical protein
VKAGPKGVLSAPPLDLRRLGRRGGDRCIRFVQRYVTVPKGTGARKPMKLRGWQRDIVHGVLDEPRPRQGLVSIPAGNGKSTLAAAMGLYGLLGDRVEGAQVLVVASDERQARIIFNTARRMVELNEDLADRIHVYADRLHEPRTDSTFMACPPTRAVCRAGTRPEPLSTSCMSSPMTRSKPWPPEPASATAVCCWPSRPRPRRVRTTA